MCVYYVRLPWLVDFTRPIHNTRPTMDRIYIPPSTVVLGLRIADSCIKSGHRHINGGEGGGGGLPILHMSMSDSVLNCL